MLGLHVSVPIACFRKGMAREYLETEQLPPPATCYGFLLSMVGETNRRQHLGARVTAGLLSKTETSVVLRTVWRVKSKPLGSPGNTRPDYQQLLSGASEQHPFIELTVWLDSTDETAKPTLEDRVRIALDPENRRTITRFGGLSLGESTHLVDSVSELTSQRLAKLAEQGISKQSVFLLADDGRMSLPVWVDHVGSADTRHVVGDLIESDLSHPQKEHLPQILEPQQPSSPTPAKKRAKSA